MQQGNNTDKKHAPASFRLLQYLLKTAALGLIMSALFFGTRPRAVSAAAMWLSLISPVLLIAALVLMFLLASEFPRKYRIGNSFFTKHILNLLLTAAGAAFFTAVFALGAAVSGHVQVQMKRNRIRAVSERAEAVITLEPSVYYEPDGIMETGIMHPALFVDYDEHTAAFLLNDHDFKVFRLRADGGKLAGEIQCEIPLDAPARALVSYYSGEENESHRTSGLLLIMEDGSEYSCKVAADGFDDDWLDLNTEFGIQNSEQ